MRQRQKPAPSFTALPCTGEGGGQAFPGTAPSYCEERLWEALGRFKRRCGELRAEPSSLRVALHRYEFSPVSPGGGGHESPSSATARICAWHQEKNHKRTHVLCEECLPSHSRPSLRRQRVSLAPGGPWPGRGVFLFHPPSSSARGSTCGSPANTAMS